MKELNKHERKVVLTAFGNLVSYFAGVMSLFIFINVLKGHIIFAIVWTVLMILTETTGFFISIRSDNNE